MIGVQSPVADKQLARLSDDEEIIVVIDNQTGEVRQCGDHSGVCVAMNPWKSSNGTLPTKLSEHGGEHAASEAAEDPAPSK